MKISIPTTQLVEHPSKHVAFQILIVAPSTQWSVWHRYSEFATLHNQIVAEFPDYVFAYPLPPKMGVLGFFGSQLGTPLMYHLDL